jgi:hypothetical protein
MLSPNSDAQLSDSPNLDQERKLRLHSLKNSEIFVKIAAKQGYRFRVAHLDEQIAHLSEVQLAAIWNPGAGARRQLATT